MKRKITRIFGVSLTLVMVLSLMVAFAPVATAADYEENDWGEWGLPAIEEDTDMGPIAVAPDGTLYAALYDEIDDEWDIVKSEDNGYNWDDTELTELDDIWGIASVVVSPNYEEDEIVYVAVSAGADGPTVYRLEEAGEGDVVALKNFPDDDDVDDLYCIDVWSDEDDYNWILAATDEDVYVLRDKLFEDWRPQELDGWENPEDSDEYFETALEVAFAPDFDTSELIWAVIGSDDGHFWVTATVSPGQWGQDVGDALIDVGYSYWLDIAFPDDYDSEPDSGDTNVYVAVTGGGDAGVWLIMGVDADDGLSASVDLFDLADEDATDMVSLEVSGDYGEAWILAGEMYSPTVWVSDDGGESWDDADMNPTGEYWTHVILDADITWGGGTYDPEESMSFVATWGEESAVSRADANEDGDILYYQVGLIDTLIDDVEDIALHPDFPDEATYFLLTWNGDNETSSLWLTENGDTEEPDYFRILCADDEDYGNFCTGDDGLYLVEYAQDDSAVYLFGENDDGDYGVWKSTDDGRTYGSQRDVEDDAFIYDWVITDDDTIYAATDEDGFYMTTNSGLTWSSVDIGEDCNDIALSPDFDDGDGFIALGTWDGDVYLSDDDGDGFDDSDDAAADLLTGDVFVAFDADFADEDADGYMLIYAAGQGDDVMVGEITDTDDVDWDALEDDENDDTQAVFAVGLQVAGDDALYALSCGGGGTAGDIEADGTLELTDGTNTGIFAIPDSDITVISGDFEDEESLTIWGESLTTNGTGTLITGTITVEGDESGATGTFAVSEAPGTAWLFTTAVTVTMDSLWAEVTGAVAGEDDGVFRLLLDESNSIWESADDGDLNDAWGLWITPGSNVLWTIDWDDAELWVLEDTLSGQVTLDSPPDGYQSDRLTTLGIAWDEMRGCDDEYEYSLDETSGLGADIDDTTDDTSVNVSVTASSEYEWKVRVAPGNPWHSRWSDEWAFNTALGDAPWAPDLYTPGGIWQYSGLNVELMPAFSWESAKNADSYQFVLADNAEFTSPLVNEKVPESAYNLGFELEYNTNYFWRIMAYDGNKAVSRWSDIGAFTTIEKPGAPPPSPAPPATVTQPAPAPIVIPTPIPPVLLWVIVGIGAVLIIAVIILIVRTRRAA